MEYTVYGKPNESGYITAVNSSAFLTDAAGWVEIDRGSGDRYHHAQGNYFPRPIVTMSGAYRYKLADGKAVECTPEEIEKQEAANAATPGPTAQDDTDAMLIDHEYRLTLLELGVSE